MSQKVNKNRLQRSPREVRHCLRALRMQRGLTLRQIAAGTGLAVSTLHAIEKQGRAVTLGTAFRLAHFYGLPVAEIWEPLCRRIARKTATPAR